MAKIAEQKVRYSGAPASFQYACAEVRAGLRTYRDVGMSLGGQARQQMLEEIPEDEVEGRLSVLRGHVDHENVNGVLDWLQEEFAGCLSLVPRGKWSKLAEGFLERCQRDGVFL